MNILTIDFDWTMADIIEAYNGEISGNENYNAMWDPIIRHMPGINWWPNYKLYLELKNICSIYKNKLYKITNHHDIVPYIENPINTLINIDHHHDYYKETGLSYNCGNWVRWLYKQNKFKQYIWIPNETSQLNLYEEKDTNLLTVAPYPMETLYHYQIDQVFLCQSPEWLSPQANELWDLWTSTLDFINEK